MSTWTTKIKVDTYIASVTDLDYGSTNSIHRYRIDYSGQHNPYYYIVANYDVTTQSVINISGAITANNGVISIHFPGGTVSGSATILSDVNDSPAKGMFYATVEKTLSATGTYTISSTSYTPPDEEDDITPGSPSSPTGTNIPSAKYIGGIQLDENSGFATANPANASAFASNNNIFAVEVDGATCNSSYQYYRLAWEISKDNKTWEVFNDFVDKYNSSLSTNEEDKKLKKDNSDICYNNIETWIDDRYVSTNKNIIYTNNGFSIASYPALYRPYRDNAGQELNNRTCNYIPDIETGDKPIFTAGFIRLYNPEGNKIYIRLAVILYQYNSTNSSSYKAYKKNTTKYAYIQTSATAYAYSIQYSIDTSIKPVIGVGTTEEGTQSTYAPLAGIWLGTNEQGEIIIQPPVYKDDGTVDEDSPPSEEFEFYNLSQEHAGCAIPLLIDNKLSWAENQSPSFFYYYTKPRFIVFARPATNDNTIEKMTISFNGITYEEPLQFLEVEKKDGQDGTIIKSTYYYITVDVATALIPSSMASEKDNTYNVSLTVTDDYGRTATAAQAISFYVNTPPALQININKSTAQRVRFMTDGQETFFTVSSMGRYLRMAYDTSVPNYDPERPGIFPIEGNIATAQVEIRLVPVNENGTKLVSQAIKFFERFVTKDENGQDVVGYRPLPLSMGDINNPAQMPVAYSHTSGIGLYTPQAGEYYNETTIPFYPLAENSTYILEARVKDCAQSSTQWTTLMVISKASPILHMSGSGYGIGFGTYIEQNSTAFDNPQFVNNFITTMNIPSVAVQKPETLYQEHLVDEDGNADKQVDKLWPKGSSTCQMAAMFNNYTILVMRDTDWYNYQNSLNEQAYGVPSNLLVFITENVLPNVSNQNESVPETASAMPMSASFVLLDDEVMPVYDGELSELGNSYNENNTLTNSEKPEEDI